MECEELEANFAISLCAGRIEYAYVSWIQGHGGGVDEEFGFVVSACAVFSGVEAVGYRIAAVATGAYPLSFHGVMEASGDCSDLDSDVGAVLWTGGEVELFLGGLCDLGVRFALIYWAFAA